MPTVQSGSLPSKPHDKRARFFETEHLEADLRGRSVRGGAATLAAQAAKFVLRLGSLAILARLLTKADFGLVAMVTAITGFVAMFKDAGLSMATVQRAQIDHHQISTLFWINVAISLLLMLAVAALAPVVAWFYGDPRLVWITIAFAGTFLLGGLMLQHQALLRRQMRFGWLATIAVIAMAIGSGSAIIAALLGAGYWALVIEVFGIQAATAVGVWVACRWRPGRPVRGSGIRPMLAFGANLTGADFLTYIRRNLDNVLIGAAWGAGALGLYVQAYKLLTLPMQQVNAPLSSVALPALSRLQNQPERYRRFYRQFIQIVAFLGMPLVTFALVAADPLVLVFLGEQWVHPTETDAVDVFRALAPAALAGTLNIAGGAVFVSLGRTDRQLRASFFTSVVIVAGMAVGLQWGVMGVARGFSVTYAGALPFLIVYAYRDSPLRLTDLGASVWRPTVASLAAGMVTALGLWAVASPWPALLQLTAGLAGFGAVYLALWAVLPGGQVFLRGLVQFRSSTVSAAKVAQTLGDRP